MLLHSVYIISWYIFYVGVVGNNIITYFIFHVLLLFFFCTTGVFVFRQSISSVKFGRGTGAIFFGYMSCGSSESSLQSCSRSSSSRYCSHDSDVGVWCDGIADSGEGVTLCICYTMQLNSILWLLKVVSAFLCRFVTITSPTHYQTKPQEDRKPTMPEMKPYKIFWGHLCKEKWPIQCCQSFPTASHNSYLMHYFILTCG